MKNKQTNVGSFATAKLQVIIAIAMITVIVFSFAACGEDNDDPDLTPQTVTYRGTADGTTYTLTITENTAGRYTAKNGDSYVLTVGTKTSSGTVTVNGSTLMLTPSSSEASPFTVTVSSSGITGMSGTITFDDGATQQAPATVTPSNTDPKSVKIENVNNNDFPGKQAGVFIFEALTNDSSMPKNTAIRYLYDVTSGTMHFDLVVPRDNTYEATDNKTNSRWIGNEPITFFV